MSAEHGHIDRRDEVAREAARLLDLGRAADIDEAIRLAGEIMGVGHRSLPGRGRVRKHARAMTMQQLGDAGYAELQRQVWRVAEQVMSTLEAAFPGDETVLVGRAARGEIDAGVTLHIRIYTQRSVTELAEMLVAHGYEEPQFDTVQTRFGTLNRILFVDEGVEVALTRCPPLMNVPRGAHLKSGRAIAHVSAERLREMIAE
jgi:hypothetical protein